ncbi:MAG: aminotransferase class IV, partial [Phycisphaerales bacterium]|nr:aminotransferase class IV [Phycisphaerales bacterium]
LKLLSRAREGAGGSGGSAADSGRSPVPPKKPSGQDPTVLIDVQPATAYPQEMFERGVGVAIADAKANPFNPFEGHKTLDYWWRLRSLQEAAMKRTSEALVFTVTNHLAGGCVSNAFVVKDGALLTPIARGEEDDVAAADSGRGAVLPSPVLPGVTRAEVLALAEGAGLRVERRMLSVSDVLGADEVFLTNSSWGVLPVVRVEAATIGDGQPGEATRMLRGTWLEGA